MKESARFLAPCHQPRTRASADWPGAVLDSPCVHPLEPDARCHDLLDDRYRGRSALVGDPSGTLFAHVHSHLCPAASAFAFVGDPNVSHGCRSSGPDHERLYQRGHAWSRFTSFPSSWPRCSAMGSW